MSFHFNTSYPLSSLSTPHREARFLSLSQNYPFIPISLGDITLIASELFEMSSAFQTQPSADEKFSHACILAIKIMTNQLAFNSRPVLVTATEGGGGFDLALNLSSPVFTAAPKAGK